MKHRIKKILLAVTGVIVIAFAAYQIEQSSIATATTGYGRDGAVSQVTTCKAYIYNCSRKVDYNVENLQACLFTAAIAQKSLERLAAPWYVTTNVECVAVTKGA
jgi:hypothetical protein